MSNRTRAFRRHHRQRMLNRAMRKVSIWAFDDGTWAAHYALRNYDNLASCSCYMCGNPRHNPWAPGKGRLTIQEQRVYNSFLEELNEYYTD